MVDTIAQKHANLQVKQLVWLDSGDGGWIASTPIGDYELNRVGYLDVEKWELTNAVECVGSFPIDDLGTAKAAAQADYKLRVLSSLDILPSTNVQHMETDLINVVQDMIVELDSLPWLPEDISDRLSGLDTALEAAKSIPPSDLTNDQKEFTLLRIIAEMGGETDSSDNKWNWISWFCSDDVYQKHSDTFNRCHERGWLSTTHDSDSDCGTTFLTAKGREVLNTPVAKKAARATECFTVVFAGDLRKLDGNPHRYETSFGNVRLIGDGNAFARIDELECENVVRETA